MVKRTTALLMLVVMCAVIADDFVLKDGTVIQGKLLKLEKRKDPSGRIVIIGTIQIDEAGTTKEVRDDDFAYKVNRDPPWVEKKKNEEWYSRTVKTKKENNWRDQLMLGKECRKRRMEDKAILHFKKAIDVKRKDIPEKADEIMKFADWIMKETAMSELAKEERMRAYLAKEKELGDDPKGLVQLGEWAERHSMEDQALAAYRKAYDLDPKNRRAKANIDRIESSIAYKIKMLTADWEKKGRALKLSVTFEGNVGKQKLQEWDKKMKELSKYIFTITEGQFFISEVTIEDNTTGGRIRIEKGKEEWVGTSNEQGTGVVAYCTAPGTPQWQVTAAGKNWVSVLCHEIFHGIYGLPDEYYQTPQCECVMRSAPNPQKLCDKDSHVQGTGQVKDPCWDLVTKRFSDVKHPNPTPELKEPPETRVMITDN